MKIMVNGAVGGGVQSIKESRVECAVRINQEVI